MKPIEQVYPDAFKHGSFDAPGDYEPLIASLGYIRLIEVHEEEYQGTSFYLLKTWNKGWGFLALGWGSCSQCDALQGCESYADLDALRAQINDSIRWFPDQAALLEWMRAKDWAVEWYGRSKALLAFGAATLVYET
jgi:hypothetical protein